MGGGGGGGGGRSFYTKPKDSKFSAPLVQVIF